MISCGHETGKGGDVRVCYISTIFMIQFIIVGFMQLAFIYILQMFVQYICVYIVMMLGQVALLSMYVTDVSGPDVSGAVWLPLQGSSIVLAAYIYCRAGPVKCSLVSNLECVLVSTIILKWLLCIILKCVRNLHLVSGALELVFIYLSSILISYFITI